MDNENQTPLHNVHNSSEGYEELIESLLYHGAELNSKNKYGNTPLHRAVLKRSFAIVECLVKNGADVNTKNENNSTPLHSALNSNECSFIILECLLKNKADPNAKNNLNQTPLHFAAMFGLNFFAERLIKGCS